MVQYQFPKYLKYKNKLNKESPWNKFLKGLIQGWGIVLLMLVFLGIYKLTK